MRKLYYLLALLAAMAFAALPWLITGCGTTAQQVAYKSIYSVQKATVNSYEAYLEGVIAGQLATNHVPAVSQRFNEFQAATLAAAAAAQWNTNAPASEQMARLSADLIHLIQTVSRR